MAGVAAGAMQTGQRIGAAIGTATLAAVFYSVASTPGSYPAALAASLLTATGFVCLALVAAVLELIARRRRAVHRAPDESETAQADVHRV